MKIIIKTIHDTYLINILESNISINNLIIKITEIEQVNKENIKILYDDMIIEYSKTNDINIINDCSLFVIIKKI
jgi:chaperonin GroEL (HSP60 family)